jgi:uncharacterized membrane protein
MAHPQTVLPWLQQTWLQQHRDKLALLLVLGLSSAMSIAIVAFRIYYSGSMTYYFLIWNLFLAWVPLGCALVLWFLSQQGRRSFWLLGLFFGGWFVFFPNSPYIVTDLLHLAPRHNIPLWYDLMLIFSFAWNGLILGFTSLWIVQGVIQWMCGRWVSWALVMFTLGLSGFGIYLGRFLRWNSWDVVTNPYELAADIYVRIVNPLAHPRTLAVTLLFSGFLAVAYCTVALLTQARWTHKPPVQSISR